MQGVYTIPALVTRPVALALYLSVTHVGTCGANRPRERRPASTSALSLKRTAYRVRGELYGYGVLYVYFTPSQGSANRSASGRVLVGAMARPASANLGIIPPLLSLSTSSHWKLLVDSPLFTTPTSAAYHPCSGLRSLQSITKHYKKHM